MNPTRNQVHVDVPLTQVSIAAMNDPANFVAEQVFPRIPVKKQSDKYFEHVSADLFRVESELRAPGSEVKLKNYKVTTGTYNAEKYALGIIVPDEIQDNADSPLAPLSDAAKILSHDMLMFKELAFANEQLVTGVWTNQATLAGATQWSDPTSDPLAAIDAAKAAIQVKIGINPELLTLTLSYPVFQALRRHPKIVAVYGGGNAAYKYASVADLQVILGVKKVQVSYAIANTANENATAVMASAVGKVALLSYVPDSPGIMSQSAGYFFDQMLSQIKRYRVEPKASDIVEINSCFDFKKTMPDAGYLFLNAVA